MTNYYATFLAQPSFIKQQYKLQIKEKWSFKIKVCTKSKITVKPTMQPKFSSLKSIIEKILYQQIINIGFESSKSLYSKQA